MYTTPSLETTTTPSLYSATFARAGTLFLFLEGLFPRARDSTALAWLALRLGGKTFSDTSKEQLDQQIWQIIAPPLEDIIEARETEAPLGNQAYAMARLLLPYLTVLKDHHRPSRSLARAKIHYIPVQQAPLQTETMPDTSRRETLLCKDV